MSPRRRQASPAMEPTLLATATAVGPVAHVSTRPRRAEQPHAAVLRIHPQGPVAMEHVWQARRGRARPIRRARGILAHVMRPT
jgi:hypothetical protein